MDDQRRFTEGEILEIFGTAAEDREDHPLFRSKGDGLTLAQLQDIGAEIGLAPERVAEAAHGVDLRAGNPQPAKWLGLPLTVRRTVALPRPPSDHEWELLITECRTLFNAPGTVVSTGKLRQWSNGNLHVCVEPTERGYHLRLGSYYATAMSAVGLGFALLSISAFTLGALALKDKLATGFIVPLFLGLCGGGALLASAVNSYRWARLRTKQMEYLSTRVQELCRPMSGG